MRIPTYQDPKDWSYGLSSFDQTHVAVINYTWDLPKASSRWNNAFARAVLDNWQISGITAFASGSPAGIHFTTVDNVDLLGGGDPKTVCWTANCTGPAGGGPVIVVTGDPDLSRGDRSLTRWFNTSAFARPASRQIGNGRKDDIRLPGAPNWDLTLFKRIPFGNGRRYVQLRWEMYNVFNQTQFMGVDTTARFDAAGNRSKLPTPKFPTPKTWIDIFVNLPSPSPPLAA
jgi:hypothetical protein